MKEVNGYNNFIILFISNGSQLQNLFSFLIEKLNHTIYSKRITMFLNKKTVADRSEKIDLFICRAVFSARL